MVIVLLLKLFYINYCKAVFNYNFKNGLIIKA